MENTLSPVNLKCLNCGAILRIRASVVEFACEYCGASQVVEREGGIVALRLLSEKVDRIQDSVDRTAAELALSRLTRELGELEEKYDRLSGSHHSQKEMINKLFWGLFIVVCFSGIFMSAYASSLIPAIIFAAAGGIGLVLLRKRIASKMDGDFERSEESLINKGIQLKKKIAGYEKVVNS